MNVDQHTITAYSTAQQRLRATLTRPWSHLHALAAILCTLGAVALAIASAYYFRPTTIVEWPQAVHLIPPHIDYSDVVLPLPRYGEGLDRPAELLVGSAILAILALTFSRRAPTLPRLTDRRSTSLRLSRLHWMTLAFGIACLWVLAEANGHTLEVGALASLDSRWQLALLVAGVVLVTWGLSGSRFTVPVPSRLAHRDLVLVMAFMALGLFLRLWNLENALRFFVDEMNFANSLRYVWFEQDFPLLQPISNVIAMPRLYPYLQNAAIPLAGRTLSALRLPSVIFGTLTIPAVYLLGKHTFDRQVALIAAFLLAVYPVHIHFSRLGLNNIADPLFGTLAFAYFAHGTRTGRSLDYALAGSMLGLTQYFYEGGRLLLPLVMLAWVVGGLILWRPRPAWRGLVITGLAALLVAAPIYYTLAGIDRPVVARLKIMSHDDHYWQNLLTPSADQPEYIRQHAVQVREALMIFVHQTEEGFYYGGQTPLLLIGFAPLVLLGLAFIARRWHRPGPLLLILWVLGTAMGNSLIRGKTEAPRNVVVFPALVLLGAVGLRYALELVLGDRRIPRIRLRWATLVLIAILAALTVTQITYYFGPHLDLFNRQLRYARAYPDGQDAMMRAIDFPANTQVHLISTGIFDERFANDVLKYFTSTPITAVTRTPADITPEYLKTLPRDVDHAFFLEPDDTATLSLLREFFTLEPPQFTRHPHVPPDRQFVLYYAPHPSANP